ncbi:unnamed protein product, partial [Aureobasidium vineae]
MAPIKTIEYFRVKPRWLFVKIVDAEGHVGWGEATLEGHTKAVEGTLNGYIDRFVGLEADDIEHIWQLAWRHMFMSALAGIDIALWDLKARRLGVPIHQLLGGKVRQKVQVYAWIGGDRPSDVAEAGKERLAQGFRAMNATEDVGWLDSPSKLDSAVDRVKTVKSLGLDVALDFHGRLHKAMAKQLAEHPEGIKQLSNLTSSPIALGERLYSRWDFKRFLEAWTFFSQTFLTAEELVRCAGLRLWLKLMMPIALAACLQIGFCTPNHMIQEMSVGMHYNTEAGEHDIHSYVLNSEVFKVTDGYLDALTGPGLGIEVNEEVIRRVAENTQPWELQGFVGVDGGLREW